MAAPIARKSRTFVSEDLVITDWESIRPYFEELLKAGFNTVDDIVQWLSRRSELENVVGEEYRWRYVRQSCDTTNEVLEKAFNTFIEQIMPQWMQVSNELNEKIAASPLLEQLDKNRFGIYLRSLKNTLELFREENIPLFTEIDKLSNEYGKISGAMTIEYDGRELTLQQAARLLQQKDRAVRQEVFEKIQNRRLQDKEKLEDLFDQLLRLRHQVALNAGFNNFRDYMMRSLGRFDYTVADCEAFHEAVAKVIVPIIRKIQEQRAEVLNLYPLRPYDLDVPVHGDHPLTPFKEADELLAKSITTLGATDPYFSYCIETMKVMGHLDLDSRKGKRPGGYNMPMPETGVPFIFMNAAGTQRDIITMVHEAGHAVHSFLTKDLEFDFEQNFGSEVAELASMSMELMTMDHWNTFYSDPELLQRAKTEQLEGILGVLPWIATVDKFQHWIYTHPQHSREERKEAWLQILKTFSTGLINWDGYEEAQAYSWHRQLHIFEVPFYYIEYGIAQLGAIGVWKNFRANPEQAIRQYKAALSLGNTATIPEIYAAAGVPFDFSEQNISQLAGLLSSELQLN